ncbi:MAG TPA: hypothetical protein VHT25_07475 [Solirubrobacteraceae bacterium]|nr:hypothetical protein [Solirubrobacteraceae bacterium]
MSVSTPLRRAPAMIGMCMLLLLGARAASPTFAQAAGAPWWRLTPTTAPTNLQPGEVAQLHVTATNVGDAAVAASATKTVTITDTIPAGLEVTEAKAVVDPVLNGTSHAYPPGQIQECPIQATTVSCTYAGPTPLLPFEPIDITIGVKVTAAASSATAGQVSIAGGGASASVAQPIVVGGGKTPFGVRNYVLAPENEGGTIDNQAGTHPFQLTTSFSLNESFVVDEYNSLLRFGIPFIPKSVALAKDLVIKLPPGLVGNATSLPQCTEAEFDQRLGLNLNGCKAATAVGVALSTLIEPESPEFDKTVLGVEPGGVATVGVPVFNLVPAPGEPARFGFDAYGNFVTLDTSVATGEDYAVVTGAYNVTEIASLLSSQVTLWGTPGDPKHSLSRGWDCLTGELDPGPCESLIKTEYSEYEAQHPSQHISASKPFLRLPTSCQTQKSSVRADSWAEPGIWSESPTELPALQGCNQPPFTPSLNVEPETQAGSSPSGMKFDVHVPQVEHETTEGLPESDIKSTTVTLPQGVLLSPAAAHGLQSCSKGEVGYQGKGFLESEPGDSLDLFTSNLSEPFCEAAKVGNVRIQTPLLDHELEGGVYLAAQGQEASGTVIPGANPFGSLLAIYIVAKDPVSGVLVKLAGKVTLDENTGQISTTFENTPQTPFEDFKLEFFGGPTANLTTPPYCGSHTTTASFVSWGGQTANSESTFQTTSNCTNPPSAQPFSPSLTAGPTNPKAGAYSPFTLTLGNPDGDQALKTLTMHLAPGMAAMLSSITPCPEPQAASMQCGEDSLIGHSTAVSGLGGNPFALPGKVYLTGPYKGAPFGLLVVTPAIAGPFNLGEIPVRSTINVDRNDASVTVSSDPFPEFIKGIPSQLKAVNVIIDRPNFEFNPTKCTPMSVTGTLTGVQGASQAVSAPVQFGNCAALPFKPTLTASTKGNASKANGAELVVKVTSTPGQANIAKTKLVLPLTLPSRLTTIQKACLAAVFEANPAGCAEGSNIGTAVVHTPVLKEALSGPAYLVSHGNAAFPDVEFVLSNKEGIELILDGQTDIKKGITTSTFNAVPDAPVTSFEAKLPEGPHSALTSNVAESKHFSLCGAKLVIPTTITGQNGAVIQQETKVPVLGCGSVKGFKVSKLSKALKACKKKFKHSRKKRAACEKQARKKYGPHKAKKHHKKK